MKGNETITVLRPTGTETDRYGNDRSTGTTVFSIEECLVAPWESDDLDTTTRTAITIGSQVFAPPGSDIEARDQVRVRGEVYEIVGEVAIWPMGVHVRLRRVRG